ncbi:MAG: class I SAM-dependent methyltransferase [Halobaculum sp.]
MTEPTETAYSAAHADYYEAITDDGEEWGDEQFYREQAREAAEPALEVACGTGRVYLELLRAGVDADGFDLSAGALDVLRQTATAAGLDPTVWRADMRRFAVARPYGFVYCPFNTISHALTTADQLAVFRAAYDALAAGGRFAFDVFVPDFEHVCETYGEWQTATREYDGESHEIRHRTRLVDRPRQLLADETELYDGDGERVFGQTLRMGLLPPQQLALVARHSPFEAWRVRGDFDHAPPDWTTTDSRRTGPAETFDPDATTAVESLGEDAPRQVWELRKSP